jgi:hypothetical protein
MSKKKNKKNAGKAGMNGKMDWLKPLVIEGEKLGNMFIEQLAKRGSSPKGLFIETYAIAKAWGTLKAVAENMHFDTEPYLDILIPTFYDEAEDAIKEYRGEAL